MKTPERIQSHGKPELRLPDSQRPLPTTAPTPVEGFADKGSDLSPPKRSPLHSHHPQGHPCLHSSSLPGDPFSCHLLRDQFLLQRCFIGPHKPSFSSESPEGCTSMCEGCTSATNCRWGFQGYSSLCKYLPKDAADKPHLQPLAKAAVTSHQFRSSSTRKT